MFRIASRFGDPFMILGVAVPSRTRCNLDMRTTLDDQLVVEAVTVADHRKGAKPSCPVSISGHCRCSRPAATPGRGPSQVQVLTCSSIMTLSPTYPTHRHLDGDRPLPTPNAPHATTGRSVSPPALPEPPCPGRPALITYTRRSARLAPLLALWPVPMRPSYCAPAPIADSPWPDRSWDLRHAEDRAVPPPRSRPDLGRPGRPGASCSESAPPPRRLVLWTLPGHSFRCDPR